MIAGSLTEFEVKQLSRQFEARGVDELLEWATARFAPRIVMTSSFGAEGVVLIDKLARIAPKTPIIYLDTGFQFKETEQLKTLLRERYDLNIVEARSALSIAEQNTIHGDRLFARDPDLCCSIRKVAPLLEALRGQEAWIAALRRDQSPTRAGIGIIEWSARHELVKIHPLACWSRKQVWQYVMENELPYNSLYDEGYASIGCEPCTKPVSISAHERSGRWKGTGKLECGIHA